MDTFLLPQNGKAWVGARGRLGLWVPHPVILVLAIEQYGDETFAAPILAAYQTLDPNVMSAVPDYLLLETAFTLARWLIVGPLTALLLRRLDPLPQTARA